LGLILHNKVREPFHIGDWFINVNEQNPDSPSQVFKITLMSDNHLIGRRFCFSNTATNLLIQTDILVQILPSIQCIKASVFHLDGKFFYCGNYLTSKLLLSRISWQIDDSKIVSFFDFSVSSIYKALLFKKDKSIPAVTR
jgi:hypothetical protein